MRIVGIDLGGTTWKLGSLSSWDPTQVISYKALRTEDEWEARIRVVETFLLIHNPDVVGLCYNSNENRIRGKRILDAAPFPKPVRIHLQQDIHMHAAGEWLLAGRPRSLAAIAVGTGISIGMAHDGAFFTPGGIFNSFPNLYHQLRGGGREVRSSRMKRLGPDRTALVIARMLVKLARGARDYFPTAREVVITGGASQSLHLRNAVRELDPTIRFSANPKQSAILGVAWLAAREERPVGR